MKQYQTFSEKETKNLAKKLAKKLRGVIALFGELGAGKTIFIQGFAQGLKIKDKIISPTFVLIRQHQIPKTKKILYHIDLYRLEKEKDFHSLGLEEILSNHKNIVLIEWADKAENILPKETTRIDIKKDANKRIITIY